MNDQFKEEELALEELDNVAGGTLGEMRDDAAFPAKRRNQHQNAFRKVHSQKL